MLPPEELSKLNALLPFQTRPKGKVQQAHYPYIHGLLLLLYTQGLLRKKWQNKTLVLECNPTRLKAYRQLNRTTQYLNHLQAWFSVPASALSFRRSGVGILDRPEWVLPVILNEKKIEERYCSKTDYLSAWGASALAMYHLFGFFKITPAASGHKYWPIKKISGVPETAPLFARAAQAQEFTSGYKELNRKWKNAFQKTFPDFEGLWSRPELKAFQGQYLGEISLGQHKLSFKASSRISLETLADLLLEEIGFDNDHLYRFSFADVLGLKRQVEHAYMAEDRFFHVDEGIYAADQITLGELQLLPGEAGTFLFDFGDHWEFELRFKNFWPEADQKPPFSVLSNTSDWPAQYDFED